MTGLAGFTKAQRKNADCWLRSRAPIKPGGFSVSSQHVEVKSALGVNIEEKISS
jgi:hypothetical protein